MTRSAKVLLFEEMRREFEHGIRSIRGVARKFGVHRRMARAARDNAIPSDRKTPDRAAPTLDPVRDFIDAILIADQKVTRKHRHTAKRIHRRVVDEKKHEIAESTVREYVRVRKTELGHGNRDTCVAQCYAPGEEGQVDWYDALAVLDGAVTEIQVFTMRAMYGGGAFHKAYLRATQQAFLEGHEDGFLFFGGVFKRLRYDNLKSAVKKILRGYQRHETDRFISFRSHWGFLSEFCNPASGNEKGGVESEVGYYRRNHLTPLRRAKNLADLNAQLLEECRKDEERMIAGRPENVGAMTLFERDHLLPKPTEGVDLAEPCFPIVDGSGCVKVRLNWYSTPLRPGTKTEVKVYADRVEIRHGGRQTAAHERSYERGRHILNLEHYLDVLTRKPGALPNSAALQQWRQDGRWPACFDTIWGKLNEWHGRLDGTRKMIGLLQTGRDYGWRNLESAVDTALAVGCLDPDLIRSEAASDQWQRSQLGERMEVGDLVHYERPLPTVSQYDELRECSIEEVLQ